MKVAVSEPLPSSFSLGKAKGTVVWNRYGWFLWLESIIYRLNKTARKDRQSTYCSDTGNGAWLTSDLEAMACSAAMPICKFFSLKLIIILFNKATKRDKDGNLITTRAACRFRMMAYFRGQAKKIVLTRKMAMTTTIKSRGHMMSIQVGVVPIKESTLRHSIVSSY